SRWLRWRRCCARHCARSAWPQGWPGVPMGWNRWISDMAEARTGGGDSNNGQGLRMLMFLITIRPPILPPGAPMRILPLFLATLLAAAGTLHAAPIEIHHAQG